MFLFLLCCFVLLHHVDNVHGTIASRILVPRLTSTSRKLRLEITQDWRNHDKSPSAFTLSVRGGDNRPSATHNSKPLSQKLEDWDGCYFVKLAFCLLHLGQIVSVFLSSGYWTVSLWSPLLVAHLENKALIRTSQAILFIIVGSTPAYGLAQVLQHRTGRNLFYPIRAPADWLAFLGGQAASLLSVSAAGTLILWVLDHVSRKTLGGWSIEAARDFFALGCIFGLSTYTGTSLARNGWSFFVPVVYRKNQTISCVVKGVIFLLVVRGSVISLDRARRRPAGSNIFYPLHLPADWNELIWLLIFCLFLVSALGPPLLEKMCDFVAETLIPWTREWAEDC
jgi:hypothetical protein